MCSIYSLNVACGTGLRCVLDGAVSVRITLHLVRWIVLS